MTQTECDNLFERPSALALQCDASEVVQSLAWQGLSANDLPERLSAEQLQHAGTTLHRIYPVVLSGGFPGLADSLRNLTSTDFGQRLSNLPLSPQHAACLLNAVHSHVEGIMLRILAKIRESRSLCTRPQKEQQWRDAPQRRALLAQHDSDDSTLASVCDSAFHHCGTCKLSFGAVRSWCSSHCVNYRGLLNALDTANELLELLSTGAERTSSYPPTDRRDGSDAERARCVAAS